MTCDHIRLLPDWGAESDAHAGTTVQHRSRIKQDPTQPNLRQVHLIRAELLEELAAQGFTVRPAELGEDVLTRGLNLLNLPRGTCLHPGATAQVEVTGLRNPYAQIKHFEPGFLRADLDGDEPGALLHKAGIMELVPVGGKGWGGSDALISAVGRRASSMTLSAPVTRQANLTCTCG